MLMVEFSELLGIDVRPYTYSYAELRAATEGFNPANKLVEGGFWPVYKVSHCSNQCQTRSEHILVPYD